MPQPPPAKGKSTWPRRTPVSTAADGSSPLRIVAIDPEQRLGGGEVQVLGLSRELMRAGHLVELWCDPAGELWQRGISTGISCRPLRIRNSVDFRAGLRLRAMLGRGRYDVVHFHTARAHAMAPYVRGHAGALVVTRRMDYVPNRLFAPWLYNRAVDGVAAISTGVAQALSAAGVAPKRLAIIRSGVDCEHFIPPTEAARERARASLALEPDDIAIGTLGALVPRKGQMVLLEALASLRARSNPHSLERVRIRGFLGGAGPLYQRMAEKIAELQLHPEVQLLGKVEEPLNFLSALDLFVMPSLNEGLGVAALEAMATGLPLIASRTGGLSELVNEGESGLLIEPGNAAALAEAIGQLAGVRELRLRMGAEGRRRALNRFAMHSMAQATLALYFACLSADEQTRAEG